MFSPLAFPNGRLLYDLSTSLPSASHSTLSPFELFREPLLVLGIADASEYGLLADGSSGPPKASGDYERDLKDATASLREQFSKALVHRLLLFNCPSGLHSSRLPEDTIPVPPVENLKTTSIKTIMCDLTAVLLAEMTALSKSFQALPTVNSPASPGEASGEDSRRWAADPSSLPRRNSQISEQPRANSPSFNSIQNPYRMSMPAQLPPTGMNTPTSESMMRSTSPPPGRQTPPAKSFDEMPGLASGGSVSRSSSISSRNRASVSGMHVAAQEKVAVHGFGSGGAGERARNKGKCRIGILVGSLYMYAGRWHDAVKELSEYALSARSLSDHLWHAKALENILVCLILLAWRGMDFQIPLACYPIIEKSANSSKSPQHTPSNSVVDVSNLNASNESRKQAALKSLRALLPDLVNLILNTYIRAANFSGESLPPLAFYECSIRLSKTLTAVHLTGGSLNEDSLQNMVLGTPLKSETSESYSFAAPSSLKTEISNLVQRAIPSPQDLANLSVADGSMILVGMASVLSSAGLHRKKGLVMKDLVAFLIPALVHARKQGAAEMGIHPAAGLSLSSGGPGSLGLLAADRFESEVRLNDFLDSLGSIYGVPYPSKHRHQHHQDENGANGIKLDSPSTYLSSQNAMQAFGNVNLKMDVLRMCINLCEALPDFLGIVRFTSALLRVAGPGNAPNPNSSAVFVSLAKEEQIRLATAISRTVNASRKLGLENVESDYWDDFLVRGLYIVAPPPQNELTRHRKTDVDAVKSGQGKQRNPFIHDPFLKATSNDAEEVTIVAGDEYEFVVTLQNPYEFEVEIPSLGLAVEGAEFAAVQHNLVLGPYRTQRFSLTGVAHAPGDLRIIGCSIKVKGCKERIFPVFIEAWNPEPRLRMKSVGLRIPAHFSGSRPVSSVSTSSELSQLADSVDPAPLILSLKVIPPQPLLILSNISLPQSSLMMLEGETTKFHIKLLNTSEKTPTDFFNLSFEDSATFGIRNAMSNKELPMPELHELEVQCAKRPTFRWLHLGKEGREDGPIIGPGEFGTFEIEVLGKPGLVDGVVQFDYGNTKEQPSDDAVYSRKLIVPITVTVNASIQLNRLDIVPFTCDFGLAESIRKQSVARQNERPTLICTSPGNETSTENFKSLFGVTKAPSRAQDSCLVLLDLRNAWPNPLTVSLQVFGDSNDSEVQEEDLELSYTIEEVIQPGHTARIVVVLPKIYLTNPHAPVPSLNPANQRQFVVSAAKFSPEAERVTRECFWYRDEFLKRVRGTWREEISRRYGELDLRGVRLNPRMVEAIRSEDISISISVLSDGNDKLRLRLRQLGGSKFEVQVGEPLTLKTSVYNRSSTPIYALLRLQPSLAYLPHNAALDLHKKFAWSGLLQRPLPLLNPGETAEVELVAYALCSGIFEVNANVDEIIPYEELQPAKTGPEDDTATKILDNLQGNTAKRTWHAAKPCTIIAKETPE